MTKVRLIKHEAVPNCGSYEIRFPDGRPSKFIYWDDLAGRRLLPDRNDRADALRVAKIFVRAEQRRLDLNRQFFWERPYHRRYREQAAVDCLYYTFVTASGRR